MNKKVYFLATLAVVATLMAGCTTRLTDFTVISSKNIDWNRANEFQRASKRVEGIDLVHTIVFVPIGVPHVKEALDRAIEAMPGTVALLDGVVIYKYWYIPYVYGRQWYVIEGTPLIDPKYAAAWTHGEYIVTQLNADGTVQETKSVTAQEYEKLRSSILPNR